MRGSRKRCWRERSYCGIIPAHAGLTFAAYPLLLVERDHPRACGAHSILPIVMSVSAGSSPRMRGSQRSAEQSADSRRIIPAHAGLTRTLLRKKFQPWDHPRACGAHLVAALDFDVLAGSSPRMRGSLSQTANEIKTTGIIPAHAGLTI